MVVGLFVWALLGVRMKKIEIMCSSCGRVVLRYDGRGTMDLDVACACGRHFKFKPEIMKLIKIDRPERKTASGTRFY